MDAETWKRPKHNQIVSSAHAQDVATSEIVSRMDALTDRVDEIEREHFDDVLSIRDEITVEVGTLQATIDGLSSAFVMQLTEIHNIGRSVEAIISGRLSVAVTATGGSQQQSVGLAIASIQMQQRAQEENETLRNWVTDSMIAARRNREESTASHQELRHEIDRLYTVNAAMQSQLDAMESRLNHIIRRGGPYEEVSSLPMRPRRVLPPTFTLGRGGMFGAGPPDLPVGLRGGTQIFIERLTGKTITIDDIDGTRIVRELKQLIRLKLHFIFTQNSDFYLIFGGHRLADDRMLNSYNIISGSTVWMVMRLSGGMDAGPHCKKSDRNPSF